MFGAGELNIRAAAAQLAVDSFCDGDVEAASRIFKENKIVSVMIDTKPSEEAVLQDLPYVFEFSTEADQVRRIRTAVERKAFPRGYELQMSETGWHWRYVFLYGQHGTTTHLPYAVEKENMPLLKAPGADVRSFLKKNLFTDKFATGLEQVLPPYKNRILGWKTQNGCWEYQYFL